MQTNLIFEWAGAHGVLGLVANDLGEFLGAGTIGFLVLRIVVRCIVAAVIFQIASELKTKRQGPFLFPPALWGLFYLVGGNTGQVLVVALFVACHFTSWIDLKRADFTPKESAHKKKVKGLQAEIEARRAEHGTSE